MKHMTPATHLTDSANWLQTSTLHRVTHMARLLGGLDAAVNAMLDALRGGDTVLDAWEAENGLCVRMTYKRTSVLGWYTNGLLDISDGDGPWVGSDMHFSSPSEAANAVADAINGRPGSSLNGNLYWKVERTGQTLGEWLRSTGR